MNSFTHGVHVLCSFSFRCGPQTNTRMLLNYGTVDEDNPYDRLTVKVRVWVGGW